MKKEDREQVGVFLRNASLYFAVVILYGLVRNITSSSLNEFGFMFFESLMIVGGITIVITLSFFNLVGTYSFKIYYFIIGFFLLITILIFEIFLTK